MPRHNAAKTLGSRGGLKMTLNDDSGKESFTFETPGGQKLVLRDGPNKIAISDANGNSVTFEASGITVKSAAKVMITASLLEITATSIAVNAGTVKFSGVIQCDTLISNSVISASYTPGAGNIM